MDLELDATLAGTPRRQLIEALRTAALLMEPGTRFPSESMLCRRYGLARMTLNRALGELVAEGVFFRERGSGTYVAPRRIAPLYYVLPCAETLRGDSMIRDIYAGARRRADELGVHVETLIASLTNQRSDIDLTVFRRLPPESRVILCGYWFYRAFDMLVRKKCRVAFVYRATEFGYLYEQQVANWLRIEIEHPRIIRSVVAKLKARGCRRFALLHCCTHHLSVVPRGFRDALAAEGLEYVPELVLRSSGDFDDGYNRTEELLMMRERYEFDALLLSSISPALGALQALRGGRVGIPQSVAVVALTDGGVLRKNIMPVSTVDNRYEAAGAMAVEKLHEKEFTPGYVEIPGVFTERASSLKFP